MQVREIHTDIWTVDGPDIVFAGAAMHTRMTVVRLSDGRLWVHSPIQISAAVTDFIEDLGGSVCALIAPNKFHYLFISQWVDAFPGAQVFAETTVQNKVPALAHANTLTDHADKLYSNDIEQQIFQGNRLFQEAVFFHNPSRSLILTDLMINLKIDGIGFLPRLFLKFEGAVYPRGGVPRLYRWLTRDKEAARQALAKIRAWAPQRVLFCHGEPFTESAEEILSREFAYLSPSDA